ncbi:MAG: amidohydrolase family protein [Chloroflexota bacterium]|nr:amidohydrolase family protein [Chloroflexota bacterium]MDE2883517.1 amidohydrolase family protein [Chloroflexota bacterium]
MIAWDADGHVYESEQTFSDAYWDAALADRRPVVVEASPGRLSWMIDGRAFPVSSGPNQALGGTPASKGGVPARTPASLEVNPIESSELRSAAARIAHIERERIEVQVNYPTMLLTWPIAHDPQLGAAIARAYNNWMADLSSQAPDRLKWVTVVDPTDPRAAAREIERTSELGSSGVMLLGMVGEKHLDDPTMEPVWEAASDLDLPVSVHVGFCCPPLGNLYTTSNDTMVVPFAFTVLMAFQRIVSTGLLDRYPRLRVAFLEAGCSWVDFMVERITERLEGPLGRRRGREYSSELLPAEYIARGQLAFGFEVEEGQLPYFVDRYGPDCLLFASDIPHVHRVLDAVNVLEERSDLNGEVKQKLLVDNTARFYGIETRADGVATS